MLPLYAMAWRVGVDVGGTFTDLAAVDDANGAVRLEKVPSTPDDQSIGVAAGLHWSQEAIGRTIASM